AFRDRHVRSALEADPGLAMPGDGTVVRVVDGAYWPEVRREIALRVVRAPPEDVSGAPRASRDEVAVVVLRARHLEPERLGRRRALLLDVRTVGVSRAAHERPEPAVLPDERPLAALRADLALAGLRRGLVARQRSRFLVLREQRAGEEPAVPAEANHHGMPLGTELVGGLRREVASPQLAALLGHALRERPVEGAEEWDPRPLAARHLVELLLHPGREREIDIVAEVLDQEVGDDLADQLGVEAPLLDADVAPVQDRGNRRGIRRRPADPVLLEGPDERRLGEARGRLREVLRRGHVTDGRDVAVSERRQRPFRVVLVRAVVAALGVDGGKPVEQRLRRARPELI